MTRVMGEETEEVLPDVRKDERPTRRRSLVSLGLRLLGSGPC